MTKLKDLFQSLFRKIDAASDPVAVDEPDLIRKKQIKRLVLIGVTIAGLAAGAMVAFDAFKKDTSKPDGKTRPQVKILQDKLASEIKAGEMQGQMKYLQDENREMKETITKLQQAAENVHGQSGPEKAKDTAVKKPLLFIPPEPPSAVRPVSTPAPQFKLDAANEETPEQPAAPKLPFAPVQRGEQNIATNIAKHGPGGSANPLLKTTTSGIRVFGESAPNMANAEKKKEKTIWLPSGSFAKGQLLSGLDAPTGGYSQSNPHPVLIRLTDLAILPGKQRMDIKECFVVGAGYGDLASERAYIRTESLSCVKKDRTTMDMPIKGYVVGEDGKVGLRGRVVSKQGQMLARALIAGIASGMSDAFKPITPIYYTSTSSQEEGRMVFPRAEDVLQAGAFGGVSKALDRLSHYYIDAAKQIFPVIEIDAARKVEVVVLKGTEIQTDKESAK